MNISLEHTTVTINGHRVQGWSSGGIQLPQIQGASTDVGPDGKMVAASTGVKGGRVTISLMANSASAKYFMQQAAQLQRGARIEFEGSLQDTHNNFSTRFERGVMVDWPSGQSLSQQTPQSRDFSFDFETVISNYDSANFTGPPAANAGGSPGSGGQFGGPF